MARVNAALLALNRGEISRHAMARVDLEKLRLSAETQVNYLPLVLGPMMLRPGTGYLGSVRNNAEATIRPFVFDNNDTAILEFTNQVMRVWINDALVSRVTVSTTVTNGDFSSGTGWTLTATAGCSATISGGVLTLTTSARGGLTTCSRSVTVAGGDLNKEHGLRIVVTRGPVTFFAGSTSGGSQYIGRTTLDTGTHSLVLTPTSSPFYVQFESNDRRAKIVDSIQIDSNGVLEIPAPWLSADLPGLVINPEINQSSDEVIVARHNYQTRRIVRNGTRPGATGWGIELYRSDDGPFKTGASANITLTPSVCEGNGTLTASRPYFRSTHVGCLFRVFTPGQNYSVVLGGADAFTPAVRVFGIAQDRNVNMLTTGVWVGTMRVQRSLDGPDFGFIDVAQDANTAPNAGSFTGNINYSGATPWFDGSTFNNVVTWYRIGFKSGEYTSGSSTVTFGYSGSGAHGICRVTGFTSETQVSIEVLQPFSSLVASSDWEQGAWSDVDGWPDAAAFHEGRLFLTSRNLWGSVSDLFTSFDDTTTGDSGPINRTLPGADRGNWLLPLTRLICGQPGKELSVRSSNFDTPLTPTDLSAKPCSSQGSATGVPPVKIDTRGIFVQRDGRRVYDLVFSPQAADYMAGDLTRLKPDIAGDDPAADTFVDAAVQRQLDTRLHLVRTDGQVAVLVYDAQDDVFAWYRLLIGQSAVGTDKVRSVCVLPGTGEDAVYYVVQRTVSGTTRHYLEKCARRDEALGATVTKLADSHIIYSGAAVTTITGLTHLDGETVCVWGNGKDLGTKTVSAGQITGLSEAVTSAVVGLPYTAQFKSAKLAYGAQMGTALNQTKRIDHIGLVMADTHFQGLRVGQSFDVMDDLPLIEDGAETPGDTVWDHYDKFMIELPGEWDTDARLCLQSSSPRPCTVMAVVVGLTTRE